ncbi:hypothetical protein WA026_012259 [Henosepilachna vigintioctopunctata]|uniref:Acyl-coenzyme A oxidase n=1 Tax=Henosepilachna vigintioctopunctata TaxID=420089 RepID=A0AAW1VDN1_9CUCU
MSEALIEDLPSGPLDEYRKQSNFNWKSMKIFFEEDVECLGIKMRMWNILSKDPLFSRSHTVQTTEEMKKLAAKRLRRYLQYNFFPSDISSIPYKKRLRLMMAVNEGLALAFPDVSLKHAVGVALVKNTLATLGTERHEHFLEAMWDGKAIACIALTEVAHGSNTKQMKTTATFDKRTQEFVIHTPDFQAAKCWSGNLGKTSTLAILFAQLIIDDQNFGLHAFVVPIRDPRTLLPYPGITVGDMGEKIGFHGLDNGFLILKNYRIPRENLLNRTADVTTEGEYESSFSEPGKILGAALENLSLARVGIMQGSVNYLINAVTIAIRYGAVRKQFSDNGNDTEFSIIEYPLHQWRLFPHVASAVVLKVFINFFTQDYLDAVELSNTSDRLEEVNYLVSEIHSIICCAKPLITWTTQHAIQECREACGGHGYLKAAGLGDLRNDHDPTVTYEGDNNVLQQQASNWLLKQWHNLSTGKKIESPLLTAQFLANHAQIKKRKYRKADDFRNPKYIMDCYEWLITYIIEDTASTIQNFLSRGYSKFSAKNHVQVYRSCIMSKAYAELNALRHFWRKISELPSDLRTVLTNFGILYGVFNIDSRISYFYQGGYCEGPHMVHEVKQTILDLCGELKPNILGVVDALSPPDYILNSILGRSDGKIYEELEKSFFNNQGNSDRPNWWSEVIIENAPDFTHRRSKL